MPTEITAFQPLADLLPEPMLIVHPDGTVRAVNRAFTAITSWTAGEVLGRPLTDLLSSPAGEAASFLRHCASTTGQLFGGFTFRVRDGAEIPCRVEGAALTRGTPERLVVLRLVRRDSSVARFVDLTQQISSLSDEIVRRRQAERVAADALESERRVRDRLTALAEASGALLSSLTVEEVLPAIGRLAVRLVAADAHAVWHRSGGDGRWRTVWQQGLSASFVGTIEREPVSQRPALPEPLYVEDVDEIPLLADRRRTYAAEGVKSLIVIPLRISDDAQGSVVAYFRQRTSFTPEDRYVASALGNLGSGALATTMLHEAESASRVALQAAADRAAFVAGASKALASSLDYEATLTTVAELAVPEIADWCAVDMVDEEGKLKRLAVAHQNPDKVELAWQLLERYPPDPASPYGPHEAMRTQEAAVVPRVPAALLESAARSPEHLALLRSLAITSYMCVPLITRGQAVGTLTFVSAESGREYTESDLRLAEDLAARAALAVENARAYREVQRVSRVKDDFLATLSHELRTPLNAVLGYARMIRAGFLKKEKRARAIEVLERNANALNQIVEDILDVSRIVAGKIRLNMRPLELWTVLEDAAATVRPAADARGVHLTTSFNRRVSLVTGDPDRLQQVVWNLLANAVKFTPRGGRVELRLDQAGSHVEIVVEDTGAGIRRDFLPHLFEPFRQSDSGFSREHGGLGLGLAISRHLVEMHGGTIRAASRGEGRGATFTVQLPVAAVVREPVPEAPLLRAEAAGAERLPSLANQLTGVRVLVVDDDADARLLVSDVLHSAGAEALSAASAREALDRMTSGAVPDVLLTDIGMPGMDGLELTREIRRSAIPELRGLPVIALTAYARSEDRLRAIENGCQMHIAKPISPEELVAAIRSLMANTAGGV